MIRNVLKRCNHHYPMLNSTTTTSLTSHFHSLSNSNANEVVEAQRWKREEEEEKEPAFKISHPLPEWVDLMKCLLNKGHFHAEGNPFRNPDLGTKECNLIRTACLNFGRDHSHLLRFLSQNDIGVIVTLGCPSLDRKVVNSGKRLRAHVGIDEGNVGDDQDSTVCSSCNLRGNCERAFVKAREDEGGRTVDVMRIILTYGLDPIIGSVDNKPCLNKTVIGSVRRLLKEIVVHSTGEENSICLDTTKFAIQEVHPNPPEKRKSHGPLKQGDWICPKCNFHNFARNIRCLHCESFCEEKIKQLQEDNEHLPLKKGDWICNKCNFLNFARNTRCLQCKEEPSNRHINPGEWECDSCNYINFRRNMVCLKCDHRRPKASNASLQPQGEDRNHHKNSKLTFARHHYDSNTEPPMGSERNSENRNSYMWSFVEDENKNDKCLNNSNDPSEFIDFPIAGGKSGKSGTQSGGESYNNESHNLRKMHLLQSETDDESCSSDNLSTDDDEEMAEWFGMGKHEK